VVGGGGGGGGGVVVDWWFAFPQGMVTNQMLEADTNVLLLVQANRNSIL
jgi:hypothetical protein